MGGESPVVEIYDSNGTPLAVQNATAIPANTPALIVAGSDGTNSRYMLVDSSGRPVMVGAGVAGTPAGGVVSIQGVASGTVVPISGTISATQNGNIDSGNSSTVTLAGSGTFTGTGIDVSVYGVVSVFVFTDQAGTLNLEWSINGTNWDDVNSYAVSASTALSIQFGPQARFFRVVYQNGGTAQGTFRLQTIERPITAFPETVPASYVIQNSDNVLLTKTVQGTSPWVDNISQFGGSNVVTGTGASGAGIPRVTVSNDSNVLVTQSTSPWVTNVTQFGSSNVVTGTGASGAGIPRVTVSNDSNILATQSGTWTVTATQTTAANLRAQTASESTTATSTGTVAALVGGAVTTSAPTYVTGQMDPLSLTTAGALRIDGSAVIQPVSGTVTANQGTPNSNANKWPVQVTDGTNNMPTGDAVTRAIFEKITDGTNTAAVKAASTAAAAADPSLVTAFSPNSPLPAGTNTIGVVNQGTAATLANAWSTKITDTTNGPVAVKAASTSPVATDQALVVVISPNQQPIPVDGAPAFSNQGISFGRALGGSGTTLTAMRATTYTEQTTNFTGSVKSSSTSDASSGTGARTVTITYYDQTGAGPLTETVTLNGTTAVNLVNTNHCFIEKMVVVTVGSGGSNAGTISLFTGSGGTGTTVGSIGLNNAASSRGDNTTLWAHHYTPTGKTTSIYLINCGTLGNQSGDVAIYSIPVLTANAAEVKAADSIIVGASGDSVSRDFPNAVKIAGFARTTLYIVANAANTVFTGGFDWSDQ